MMEDPLVTHWRDTSRPLNWRAWRTMSALEQARLRWHLCAELQWLDTDPAWQHSPWAWRHTHRQLLEVKAASGHGDCVGMAKKRLSETAAHPPSFSHGEVQRERGGNAHAE